MRAFLFAGYNKYSIRKDIMTILSNVNVGSSANSGTGDPLRNAFQTINLNFANITATGNAVTGVSSVAGRTGNIILTVNDVLGAISIGNTAVGGFTTGNIQNWTPIVPTSIGDALDQLALRLKQSGH